MTWLLTGVSYAVFFGLLVAVVLMYRRYAADIGHKGVKWSVIGGITYIGGGVLFGVVVNGLRLANTQIDVGNLPDASTALEENLALMFEFVLLGISANILAAGSAYLVAPWMLRREKPEAEVTAQRSRGLKIVLILLGVGGAFGIVSNLTTSPATIAAQLDPRVNAQWFRTVVAAQVAIGSASLIAIVALWRWRRWGLFLIVTCGVFAMLTNFLILPWPLALLGILGIALIVWLVFRQWAEFS